MIKTEINKNQLLARVTEIVKRLPPVPNNVDRILTLSKNSEINSHKIISLVKEDPGLCVDVIHLAKQAHNNPNSISSIDDACKLLGPSPIIELIRFCYAKKTIRERFSVLKYLKHFFQHSRKISKSCRILAVTAGESKHKTELYATAGLIHDIGRLVIALASDSLNAPLLGSTPKQIATIDHDEKRILGLSHSQVGWQLCKKWNFSNILQQAVLRHHNPIQNKNFNKPAAFIFTAHLLSFGDLNDQIICTSFAKQLLTGINITEHNFIKAREKFLSEENTEQIMNYC